MVTVAAASRAWTRVLSVIAVALAVTWGGVVPAAAQRVPDANVIEITVKRHLASFNDANVSGNYDVWHTTLSRPFRQQFSAERLKTAFKAFHDQQIDIAPILSLKPNFTETPRIDNEGALILKGTFETRPSRVIFDLRLLPAEGDWKLIAINVNVQPATAQQPGAAPNAAGKM